MEISVVHLKLCLKSSIILMITGCGFFSDDSYDEDVASDRKILQEIIDANPILDSAVNAGHYFFPTGSETGKITGEINFTNLSLNDSNFIFPESIQQFRRVNSLYIAFNDFTDLPRGTMHKNWQKIVVLKNKICEASSETVAFLDKATEGSPGGYWRDSQ